MFLPAPNACGARWHNGRLRAPAAHIVRNSTPVCIPPAPATLQDAPPHSSGRPGGIPRRRPSLAVPARPTPPALSSALVAARSLCMATIPTSSPRWPGASPCCWRSRTRSGGCPSRRSAISRGIPRAAARRSLHTLPSSASSRRTTRAASTCARACCRSATATCRRRRSPCSRSPSSTASASAARGCSLAMLDGDEIVYLARSTSSRIMSPSLNVGRRLPAYCTSIGHVHARASAAGRIERLPRADAVPSYTEYTPNSADKLRALLERGPRVGLRVREPA